MINRSDLVKRITKMMKDVGDEQLIIECFIIYLSKKGYNIIIRPPYEYEDIPEDKVEE